MQVRVPAADANEAMRQVLEVLIEHSGEVICGCSICEDYLRVREILLGRFVVTPQPMKAGK